MSKAWHTKPLGELCNLINGRAFKPSDWVSEGLPIVRIQNLNDAKKPFNYFKGRVAPNHLIDTGEVLLSWSGTPGTSFGCFRWERGPGVLNQHIFKVIVDESQIDSDFFIAAVNSRLEEMISKAHGGVGLRHITKSKLEAIHLPVPQLPEQHRIVARMKECMERVEEIERLRRTALSECSRLASAVFEAIEEDDEWPFLPLGHVVERSRNGRSIRQDAAKATGYVLSLAAVREVTLNCDAKKAIPLPDKIRHQYAINKGDVFVSRANTRELVGLASIAESTPEGVIFPDLLIKLETKRHLIRPRFLAYALRTRGSRRQIMDRAVGTSQSMVKISADRLKEVCIRVPSMEEQDCLLERLEAADSLSTKLLSEIKLCDSSHLRDAILRKAFAGEL
jgi:type I restriction enzyme, S subunit